MIRYGRRPLRHHHGPGAGISTPCSSTPRSTTPSTAPASSATSPTSPASPATGRWPPTGTRPSRAIRAAGRQGKGHLRPLRRRRLLGRRRLIHEAIGDQLTCVFVDNGLLRKNEAEEVVTLFRDHYNIPLNHADESRPLPRRPRGRRPTPRRSARPSAGSSSRSSRHAPRRSATRGSSPRAPSTPTSSRASASPAAPRSRSRATTTSAACPSG